MNHIPDLTSQLNLDRKFSESPFGGNHRTILITKTFSSTGDFVFNNLLHHFSRREPKTPILLVTLSQNWANYSAGAAKCGYNLRRSTNGGNIEVLDIMDLLYEAMKRGDGQLSEITKNDSQSDQWLDQSLTHETIIASISSFISKHTQALEAPNLSSESCTTASTNPTMNPVIVMIDDLTILRAVGFGESDIYKIFATLDKHLRERSKSLPETSLSHLIVQATIVRAKEDDRVDDKLSTNYFLSNMENLCDIYISLKPLDTGYSPRVDGTVKIIDNRLPAQQKAVANHDETSQTITGNTNKQSGGLEPSQLAPMLRFPAAPMAPSSLFRRNQAGDIGAKRAFFYKLGDRRARLTSSALIL